MTETYSWGDRRRPDGSLQLPTAPLSGPGYGQAALARELEVHDQLRAAVLRMRLDHAH